MTSLCPVFHFLNLQSFCVLHPFCGRELSACTLKAARPRSNDSGNNAWRIDDGLIALSIKHDFVAKVNYAMSFEFVSIARFSNHGVER